MAQGLLLTYLLRARSPRCILLLNVRVNLDDCPADTAEGGPGWIREPTHPSALSIAPDHQKAVQLGTLEPAVFSLLKQWLKPAIVALTLFLCVGFGQHPDALASCALGLTAVLISHQTFGPLRLRRAHSWADFRSRIIRLTFEWCTAAALLLFLGVALRLMDVFPRQVILTWLVITPVMLVMAEYWSARTLFRSHSLRQRHIIIGANEVGAELARRVSKDVGSGTFMGFFDFRSLDRLPEQTREQFAGKCKDVANFVRRNAVNAIYIALPMHNAPRIEQLLREFRDTTASIYFVLDIFGFDLLQARCVELNGIPMLSICDTPFQGMNGLRKRTIDLALASIGLLLLWPLMLAAAAAVKVSSPGPILFKQRRYGLHGEEILVYKFRSMTVCEDGAVVEQAQKDDRRFTAVGRFLRRTSLDELPQLFNVIQGKMSFVGPRPHAVAHNELYRNLISGYMIRHKVRPGITGWAQVHGHRGETATVDQMRQRVQHDLDYLQNWSLWLDIRILFRTALIVFHGRNAF
jgi:putative colanic acid biosynthesis UDP-glucose lipid carrier transferase